MESFVVWDALGVGHLYVLAICMCWSSITRMVVLCDYTFLYCSTKFSRCKRHRKVKVQNAGNVFWA